MHPPGRAHQTYPIVRDVFILVVFSLAVISAIQIARQTRFDAHPDELAHVGGFCYFENQLWPPDLNADGLIYCDYGWSRVYDRQLVYLLYGQLAHLGRTVAGMDPEVRPATDTSQAQAGSQQLTPVALSWSTCRDRAAVIVGGYRTFNIALFSITLFILFLAGHKHPWAWLIGLTMVCIPQVIYLYAYANSDAWGLSMSVFLFVFVLTRVDSLFRSRWNLLGLAVLTGLVILSKETFWAALPLIYLLVGWSLYLEWQREHMTALRRAAFSLVAVAVVTILIVAPMRVYYPLTQGDFAAKVEAMREMRAAQDFKPSHPIYPGYRNAARGVSLLQIMTDPRWYRLSVKSFYGYFGFMEVASPVEVYFLAIGLMLLLAGGTYSFLIYRWDEIPGIDRLMLLVAPVWIMLPVLASLYNSWTYDYQPQGRYLFAGLIPLAVMCGGTLSYEPRWLRGLRLGVWVVLYGMCLYVVWFTVLGSPVLE